MRILGSLSPRQGIRNQGSSSFNTLPRSASMKTVSTTLAAMLCIQAAICSQANYSVITASRWDAVSLDDKGGELSKIRPFGLWQFTPANTGTAAYHVLSPASLSALMGDPDADGSIAVFNGMKEGSTTAITGAFIRDADRKKNDPRLVYWTVKDYTAYNTKIQVFRGGKAHVMRPGDFVRIRADGNAEFFITQELIMKAAGPQTGSYINGAIGLCQSSTGALFYIPAHGRNAANAGNGGGHWINNPSKVFALDGAICHIPASAITYDTAGNVKDVQASSATMAFAETGSGPGGEPSTRGLIGNSGFLTANGTPDTTTLWLSGVEIDPGGGTFKDWNGTVQPNLIFTSENYAWSTARYSWAGTIFSTAPNNLKVPGTIAVINGVPMGVTTGKATGAWTGLKNTPRPPCLRGLALIQGGHKPLAPSGPVSGTAINDGVVTTGTDPNVVMAFQDANRVAPALLMLGAGPATGQRSIGANIGAIASSYADLHVLKFGPIINVAGVTDINGRITVTIPTPTSTALKGVPLYWQVVFVRANQLDMTPPVLTEIR